MFTTFHEYVSRERIATEDQWAVHVLEREAIPFLEERIPVLDHRTRVNCVRLLTTVVEAIERGEKDNVNVAFFGSSDDIWTAYFITCFLRRLSSEANAVHWARRVQQVIG